MRQHHEQQSKYFCIENHFLNTFFSGLYLSAADFMALGREIGLQMQMHSREMLIKELLNKADENGKIGDVIASMNRLIDERIAECHRLSLDYPGTRGALAKLAQKATGSKALLAREVRGNPYEH